MRKLAFITILMAFHAVLFSQNCDETFSGEGTFYGYGGGGNCSFATPTSPVYTGAMNEAQYDTAVTCGACVEVTGAVGSLVISIEDRCPECKYGDIDLSEEAFPLIDDKVKGRVPITWKFVACPVTGPVKFYFKEGTSQWWTAVQIRNHKYPIAKLEYKVNGNWVNMERRMYNYFVVESGLGTGPFDFRITDMYGDIIEETNIPLLVTTEIDGQNQFPDCGGGSSDISVAGVSVSPETTSIGVGGTIQLTATVSPTNATNKSISWSSSNASVAKVSTNGTVTGISEGSTTITVTTTDGSFTATSKVSVTGSGSSVQPCENPTTISLPFTQDGVGDFCFVTSEPFTYINSWNIDKVEINGVDYTGVYSETAPEAINGNYYIHYVGTVGWAHMEISTTKSSRTAISPNSSDVSTELQIIPNPVTNHLKISFPEIIRETSHLKIFDNAGRVIKTETIKNASFEMNMENFEKGIYNVVVTNNGKIYRKSFVKN